MFVMKLLFLCSMVLKWRGAYGDPNTRNSDSGHPNLVLLRDSCGNIDVERIIPGEFAGLYNFPWMALILYNTSEGPKYLCSGTIINSKYILTAARCVYNMSLVEVRIGEYDLRYKDDCEEEGALLNCESSLQDISVEEFKYHEDFDMNLPKSENDIALIRLKEPVNFVFANAEPVCLPATDDVTHTSVPENVRAVVTGWALSYPKKDPSVLRKDFVTINNRSFCNISKSDDTSGLICASGGVNGCVLDSGSPLITESKYGDSKKYVQHGIYSVGPGNCDTRRPSLYTDVSKHMDWILNNMKA